MGIITDAESSLKFEGKKVIYLSRERNKNKHVFPIQFLKNERVKMIGRQCESCGREHRGIELDHIIPVSIGGEIHSRINTQLLCKRCHLEKTKIDKMIINCLKTLNFLDTEDVHTIFYVAPKICINFYKSYFEIIKQSKHIKKEENSWESREETGITKISLINEENEKYRELINEDGK